MISKATYSVLKQIPRWPETTTLAELHKNSSFNVSLLTDIVKDACYDNYVGPNNATKEIVFAKLFLTEAGQIEVEAYEAVEENRTALKESLKVAKAARTAAIASAVAAFLALIPQLPELVSFFKSFFSM